MAKVGFHFTKKKLLLLGFLFVILLAIPLTVYLVQQQQKTQSHATPNTTMSFTPSSTTAAVGDQVSFDITVSPGNNQISSIKLVLKFDSTKLSASSSSFTVDPASPLTILQGPVVGSDTISVSMNVGSDPTKIIKTDTKIGTVTFDVIAGSTLPTEISFDPATQVSSINGANNDGFNENVFLSGAPANITIQEESGEANPSPTLSPSPTTPASQSANSQNGTNEVPVCSGLESDVSATGVAPYAINFTVQGTDSDGTISKVAFNFGEGTVEEVTDTGGVGTDSVDATLAHTYETPGSYTASAVLTDDQGGTSDSVNCTMAISITDASGNGGASDDQTSSESATVTPEVSPLPPTGPTQKLVGFGALGGILLLIGALLFLAL